MGRGYSESTENLIVEAMTRKSDIAFPLAPIISEVDLASALEAADPSRMTFQELEYLEQATSNLVAEGGPDAA